MNPMEGMNGMSSLSNELLFLLSLLSISKSSSCAFSIGSPSHSMAFCNLLLLLLLLLLIRMARLLWGITNELHVGILIRSMHMYTGAGRSIDEIGMMLVLC